MKERIKQHFSQAQAVLESFLQDEKNMDAVAAAAGIMSDALRGGRKIISCGNGGSMCDAMHFAEELSGRYREDRPALAAVSISDPSHLSCVGNDYGFDHVFARYVAALGRPGDVLLAISTSGNSKNVLLAAKAALARGMKVVALTGKDGGVLKDFCTIEIRAPHAPYADRVQEIHIKVIHALIDAIEQAQH